MLAQTSGNRSASSVAPLCGTHLVAPPGDGGDEVAAGRVPLHIRGHVVFRYVHQGAVRRVHEGQSSIHTEHAQENSRLQNRTRRHRQNGQIYDSVSLRLELES